MFKFWLITFANGTTAVMRQTVVGNGKPALLQADGTFAEFDSLPEFTATQIGV